MLLLIQLFQLRLEGCPIIYRFLKPLAFLLDDLISDGARVLGCRTRLAQRFENGLAQILARDGLDLLKRRIAQAREHRLFLQRVDNLRSLVSTVRQVGLLSPAQVQPIERRHERLGVHVLHLLLRRVGQVLVERLVGDRQTTIEHLLDLAPSSLERRLPAVYSNIFELLDIAAGPRVVLALVQGPLPIRATLVPRRVLMLRIADPRVPPAGVSMVRMTNIASSSQNPSIARRSLTVRVVPNPLPQNPVSACDERGGRCRHLPGRPRSPHPRGAKR